MAQQIRVLVIGSNRFPFHRLQMAEQVLASFLPESGITVGVTTDRDDLLLDTLNKYDVLVDYTTDSTLTDDQRNGLLEFVKGGNGYVPLHCAADLTSKAPAADSDRVIELDARDPVPELRDLIGGHFVRHPDQGAFDVNIVYSHHPITASLDQFSVWDEPYVLEYDSDLQVLARMDHQEIGDMPVAWTKRYGEGRVFYCSLGHTRHALNHGSVQQLITSGVHWAMGGSASGQSGTGTD